MGLQIRGWTDRHGQVALAAALALLAAGAGVAEGRFEGQLIVGASAAVFVISLGVDSWAGLVVGLVAAALVIGIRQAMGSWVPPDFPLATVEIASLVATGWAAGRAGGGLRHAGERDASDAVDAGGVFGSTGMLPADLGLVRLEEEMARATSYRRPLSLVLIDAEAVGSDLDQEAREAVFRAVARVAETMLREMDVPFVIASNRIGAILPETGPTAAAIASGRILEAVSTGRFIHRGSGERRSLTEAVAVRLAVVSLTTSPLTPDELMARASSALEPVPSRG